MPTAPDPKTIRDFGTSLSSRIVVAVDDALAVGLKSWDGPDDRAGRDDDVLSLDGLGLAVGAGDFYSAGEGEAAHAAEDRHLVLLHQVGDAGRVLGDDLVLALLHVGEGELDFGRLHAELLRVLHLLVDVSGHQQLLRRDAPAQAAGAAQTLSFSTSATLRPNCAPRMAAT